MAQFTTRAVDELSAGTSEVTYIVAATTHGHTGTTNTDSTTGYTAFHNN